MSLSVCLITRDAEQAIARALRSIAPLVASLDAEVLVGDTGSRDATVEVARSLGATTWVVSWQDDFAAAQNEVLARATRDWILWLEPHLEVLDGIAELPALLARPEVLAYLVRSEEVTRAGPPGRTVEILLPLLFRRLPDLRFVGRLHPHLAPSLEDLARREGKQIVTASLLLRHHAYESVLTEEKLRWAARLLERELADRPGQLDYLIEQGRTLLRLNDPRGHTILAEACEQVLAAQGAPRAPSTTVASLLEYVLTVSADQSKARLEPALARELALRWFPTSPVLLWTLAQRSFVSGAYREAAECLERLIALGQTGTYDRSAAFDPVLLGEPALLNLGICYLRLGELDRAEACFVQVLPSPAYQAKARQGHAMVQEARRKRL